MDSNAYAANYRRYQVAISAARLLLSEAMVSMEEYLSTKEDLYSVKISSLAQSVLNLADKIAEIEAELPLSLVYKDWPTSGTRADMLRFFVQQSHGVLFDSTSNMFSSWGICVNIENSPFSTARSVVLWVVLVCRAGHNDPTLSFYTRGMQFLGNIALDPSASRILAVEGLELQMFESFFQTMMIISGSTF